MTTQIELKPCPFCGTVPVFFDRGINVGIYHEPSQYGWDVQCQTVGCFLEFGADWWGTQEDTAEMWNKRVPTATEATQ